jgi:NADH-quinone oxidoreductase subunit E
MSVEATNKQAVDDMADFAFSPENLATAQKIVAKYPTGRQASAVLPLLALAQRQLGWLPKGAMDHIAGMLDMAPIRVYEVSTFYTMYRLNPGGKHVLEICTTTPCWLRGSDQVVEACRKHLGIDFGETTPDGLFTMLEVECLGACVNAPMLQIEDDFFEDLNAENTVALLETLKRGETPKPGSQTGRQTSAPASGLTTLTSPEAYEPRPNVVTNPPPPAAEGA